MNLLLNISLPVNLWKNCSWPSYPWSKPSTLLGTHGFWLKISHLSCDHSVCDPKRVNYSTPNSYVSVLVPLTLENSKWFFKKFYYLFIYFLLYNTVLVLPYINMNLPRVYTCFYFKSIHPNIILGARKPYHNIDECNSSQQCLWLDKRRLILK